MEQQYMAGLRGVIIPNGIISKAPNTTIIGIVTRVGPVEGPARFAEEPGTYPGTRP